MSIFYELIKSWLCFDTTTTFIARIREKSPLDKFNSLKEKYPIIYYFNQSRIHYLIMLNTLNISKNEKYGYEFFYKILTPEYCSRNTVKKIITHAILKKYLFFEKNLSDRRNINILACENLKKEFALFSVN
jgi:hypothetical protein